MFHIFSHLLGVKVVKVILFHLIPATYHRICIKNAQILLAAFLLFPIFLLFSSSYGNLLVGDLSHILLLDLVLGEGYSMINVWVERFRLNSINGFECLLV